MSDFLFRNLQVLTLPTGLSNTTGIVFSGVADATSMNGITWMSFDVVHE